MSAPGIVVTRAADRLQVRAPGSQAARADRLHAAPMGRRRVRPPSATVRRTSNVTHRRVRALDGGIAQLDCGDRLRPAACSIASPASRRALRVADRFLIPEREPDALGVVAADPAASREAHFAGISARQRRTVVAAAVPVPEYPVFTLRWKSARGTDEGPIPNFTDAAGRRDLVPAAITCAPSAQMTI